MPSPCTHRARRCHNHRDQPHGPGLLASVFRTRGSHLITFLLRRDFVARRLFFVVDAAARRAVDGRGRHAGALLRGVDVAGVDGPPWSCASTSGRATATPMAHAVALACLMRLMAPGLFAICKGATATRRCCGTGAKAATVVMTASAKRPRPWLRREFYVGGGVVYSRAANYNSARSEDAAAGVAVSTKSATEPLHLAKAEYMPDIRQCLTLQSLISALTRLANARNRPSLALAVISQHLGLIDGLAQNAATYTFVARAYSLASHSSNTSAT